MKRLVATLLLTLATICAEAKLFRIKDIPGGFSAVLTLPDGFDTQNDSCDMVILMHGFWINKAVPPMPHIASFLADRGIASIRFDFHGCGSSPGRSTQMTIETELADARVVYEYVRKLPYVRDISLLGHSQGGLVAGMTAGRLADEGIQVRQLVLLAPALVIRDYARNGEFFGIRCNPDDPPESLNIYGYTIGRDYILAAQSMEPLIETMRYRGPVTVVHGTEDSIVPYVYGEAYAAVMPNATLITMQGANHLFWRYRELDSILSGLF